MKRKLVGYLFVPVLVIAAVLAGAAAAQDVERGGPAIHQTPEPLFTQVPGAPSRDERLAQPPTVAAPNQADDGEQLYWLHCQPCHGDVGQGLTEEWRAQYPPEDQNCWESGCHGERPYDNGFILPTAVPALVGDDTLVRFPTAGSLFVYSQSAMPFWNPASLTEAEYLAITAHLARENGLWDGTELTAENAGELPLRAGVAAESTVVVMPEATPVTPVSESVPLSSRWLLLLGIGAVAVVAATGYTLWQRRTP